VQVAALVDESGKVLDASGSSDAVASAKSFTLPFIAWPDHQLPSVRSSRFAGLLARGFLGT